MDTYDDGGWKLLGKVVAEGEESLVGEKGIEAWIVGEVVGEGEREGEVGIVGEKLHKGL